MNGYAIGVGYSPVKLASHDLLYVKTLILENMVFVSMDLTSLTDNNIQHFKKIIQEIIDTSHVYISVTHNFSSPHIHEKDIEVRDCLYVRFDEALRNSIQMATQTRSTCTIEYGVGQCFINVNRNVETKEGYWIGQNNAGYSNHDVRVLLIKKENKCIANIINYDLQCSVLDKVNVLSADIAGYVSQRFFNENIVSFFVPGAAADQMPKYFMQEYSEIKRLGELLYDSIPKSGITISGRIIYKTKLVELPKQVMKYATKDLKPHKTFDFEITNEKLYVPIEYIGFDQLNILLTKPEFNSEYGVEIQCCFNEHTMVFTLINGGCKYLPQKLDYEKVTYMSMNTTIAQGADRIFLDAVMELKKEVRDESWKES